MTTKTMAIAIGILIALCAGIFFYAEWQKAKFDASLPQPPTEVQAAETEGGHWHGDEWHAEPHNANFVTPIAEPPEVDFSVQPTAAPETESDAQFSDTLAEILATPEYAERLRVIRRIGKHDPAYAKWAEEDWILLAEQELLWQEEAAILPTELEARVEFVNALKNRSLEERQAFGEKFKAYQQKLNEWHERYEAHQAKMPSSVSGGQQ